MHVYTTCILILIVRTSGEGGVKITVYTKCKLDIVHWLDQETHIQSITNAYSEA